ncbi:MAG: nickel pincer cofactor biosynthesis protein LarB [Planctomycetota bacterium]
MTQPPPSLNLERLTELLTGVATGRLSVEDAVGQLPHQRPAPASQVRHPLSLDLDRERRCGFPEVVFGQGKSAELIRQILTKQQKADQPSLVTRIDPDAASDLQATFQHSRFNATARTLSVGIGARIEPRVLLPDETSPENANCVAVVSAGSTDAAVAEEAIETLAWMGIPIQVFHDIGVAGPERLLSAVPLLRRASAVVVVAGMEGALPAAVGGHLDVPVFAVPTSVGYGATLGGLTPMLGMLSCCSSNVAVVNIDAGFKGGYLAGLVARQSHLRSNSQ